MPQIPFNDRPRKNEKQESIDYVKSLIEQARTDARDSDIPKLEKLIQLLNSKKYGLVWEEHAELVEEEMKTKIPVFVEDKNKKINDNPDSEDFNFLLEGDNLHSLHLLEKTHLGKIDVIYIDPPYNTGSKDFKYNDSFVDEDDTFRHSKWLSFMERRLRIAKDLLTQEGVIFISIDDNEQAQLKTLMDEIFGEENFLNQFIIQVRYSDKTLTEAKTFQPVVEYILAYSNRKSQFIPNQPTQPYTDDKFIWDIKEKKSGTKLNINGQEVIIFKAGEWELVKKEPEMSLLKETWISGTIYTKMSYGQVYQSVIENRVSLDGNGALYKIMGRGEDGRGYRYYTNPKKSTSSRGKMFSGMPLVRQQEILSGESVKKLPIINYYDFSADFGNIRHEGGVAFNSGKKPIKLLKQLINYHPNANATILDFFAGSGSTGHAVLSLNKEDGGKRKFIIATNSEVIDSTYLRMQNVSNDLPMNLKYFDTDFVIKENFPDVSLEYELLKYITPLVELEFAVDIANPKVQIVITDEQLESLIKNNELVAHSTLFMHPDIFRDAEQSQILSDLQIKVQEIPNYFFGMELWSK